VFDEYDCLVIVCLTHGTSVSNKDVLFGSDGRTVEIDDIIEPFKSCEALAGKPKVFIFQVSISITLATFISAYSTKLIYSHSYS
jgi:Caspase domain